MRLKLLIYYLAVGQSTQALPIAATDSETQSGRTRINIIWTCLVTIFSCTWVAVHPNVPAPRTKGSLIALRRLRLMVIGLVAPEIVIVWAIRQYIVAQKIANRYREGYKWTQAHGYFTLMGGFMIFKDDNPNRTVQEVDLEPLLRSGAISITKEEIKDKGNGDMLSKAVVVIQTGWFILQCIARRLEHLPITELEIATLAFAALNFVTYGLWWYKPLDVQCPLRVYEEVERSISHDSGSIPKAPEALNLGVKVVIGVISKLPVAIAGRIKQGARLIREKLPKMIFSILEASRKAIKVAAEYVHSHDIPTILKDGVRLWLIVVSYPIMLLARLGGGEKEMKNDAKQVPTFYAGELSESENLFANFFGVTLATIFGAIHCVAWPFQFPSYPEQWLWRASSLTITCVPLALFLLAWKGEKLSLPPRMLWLPAIIYCAGGYLYIYARVFLLLLPIVALRSLPPGAYQEVRWTTFIPHV